MNNTIQLLPIHFGVGKMSILRGKMGIFPSLFYPKSNKNKGEMDLEPKPSYMCRGNGLNCFKRLPLQLQELPNEYNHIAN